MWRMDVSVGYWKVSCSENRSADIHVSGHLFQLRGAYVVSAIKSRCPDQALFLWSACIFLNIYLEVASTLLRNTNSLSGCFRSQQRKCLPSVFYFLILFRRLWSLVSSGFWSCIVIFGTLIVRGRSRMSFRCHRSMHGKVKEQSSSRSPWGAPRLTSGCETH